MSLGRARKNIYKWRGCIVAATFGFGDRTLERVATQRLDPRDDRPLRMNVMGISGERLSVKSNLPALA